MDPILAAVLGFTAALVLVLLVLVLSGGFTRFGLAWDAFGRVRKDEAFAKKVQDLITPPPPPPPPKPTGEGIRLLGILQRESRLLDFLMEDISGAADEQVGAAMKDLQPRAQATLKKHLSLEPVLPQQEGDTIEVPAGFDPSAVQLQGNVTGKPPFRGTLRHGGWRAREIKLPALPQGHDPMVLAPAEVELP